MPDTEQPVKGLTAAEISALASRNELPGQSMPCIDWLLWYMLRDVYADFNSGISDKVNGAERKRKALSIWEREHERIARDNAIVNRAAELWKSVEEAAAMYRKDRTLQNADLVMLAIYGIGVNDEALSEKMSDKEEVT